MLQDAPRPASFRQLAAPVDHIGFVVADLAREVAAWRARGFAVSDPEALTALDPDGHGRPLGQMSAHAVFKNAYIELSAPIAGANNHLEPFLALGEGARIVVFAAQNAEKAHDAAARAGIAASPPMIAGRSVALGGSAKIARFRWFRLADHIWPGVLCAVVEHLTPELVFHPGLITHPNGARRLSGLFGAGQPTIEGMPYFGAGPDRGVALLAAAAVPHGGLIVEEGPARERLFVFAP